MTAVVDFLAEVGWIMLHWSQLLRDVSRQPLGLTSTPHLLIFESTLFALLTRWEMQWAQKVSGPVLSWTLTPKITYIPFQLVMKKFERHDIYGRFHLCHQRSNLRHLSILYFGILCQPSSFPVRLVKTRLHNINSKDCKANSEFQ